MKRAVAAILGVFLGLAIVIAVALSVLIVAKSEEQPTGQAGPAAEQLADRIERAVGIPAWRRSGAVQFTFLSGTRHFRDLQRDLVEVRWQDGRDEIAVQYSNRTREFVALRNENPIADPQTARRLFAVALKRHTNDLFWLNPFSMLRAPHAQRLLVGERALLVRYTGGGQTPGDAYLFITDRQYQPVAVKMWVSLLPLKGLRFAFEGWQQYPGGVRLSLEHPSSLFRVDLRDVRLLPSYPNATEADRFSPLLKRTKRAE